MEGTTKNKASSEVFSLKRQYPPFLSAKMIEILKRPPVIIEPPVIIGKNDLTI
jgi:hypothetical protein